jgi:membrane fusion protein, copper/silver efflux system
MNLKRLKIYIPGISILIMLSLISCEHHESANMIIEPQKSGLKLSEAQIQLANIKVEDVTRGLINHELFLTGVLKVDEQSVASINSRSNGRIQKLHFKNTGAKVNVGDSLYDFYSEDLLAIAREFQSLHDNNWSSNKRSDLEFAAQNKLLLSGMLQSQIDRLNDTRYIYPVFTIFSPEKGIIRSISVTEGEYVNSGQKLFELADDSKLWVEAQVYPNELQLLKPGMQADVFIPAAGDLYIPNKISIINPAYEPGTNITIVRAIINNPGKQLYPGMPVFLRISTEQREGIVIPSSALLIDKLGYHAWVQLEDGTFESRDLTVGVETTDQVLVVSGLEESEKVVVSGAYLLNSEKILKKSYESASAIMMAE